MNVSYNFKETIEEFKKQLNDLQAEGADPELLEFLEEEIEKLENMSNKVMEKGG